MYTAGVYHTQLVGRTVRVNGTCRASAWGRPRETHSATAVERATYTAWKTADSEVAATSAGTVGKRAEAVGAGVACALGSVSCFVEPEGLQYA